MIGAFVRAVKTALVRRGPFPKAERARMKTIVLVMIALIGIGSRASVQVTSTASEAQSKHTKSPQYKIQVIEDATSFPVSINDDGVIVTHQLVAFDTYDAVRLTPRRQVDVLWRGAVYDVNVSGQIVGRRLFPGDGDAVIWSEGILTSLGSGGAYGLNDLGEAVGYSSSSAAYWDSSGALALLPTLGGDAVGWDINNSGVIVGASHMVGGGPYYAVVWKNGVISTLDTLCGSPGTPCDSQAYGINSGEQIVGFSNNSSHLPRAVVWTNGVPLDVGPAGGASHGFAINDAGWAVGQFHAATGGSAAWVFDGTDTYDLMTLARGRNPFTRIVRADAINNWGDIVGLGYVGEQERLFLAKRLR